MKNDLISRSELKETLMECLDETQIQETLEFFGIYDFIDNAPTAYNVEKVVEQLEEMRVQAEKDMQFSDTFAEAGAYGGKMFAYEVAIAIVQNGGNADVSEINVGNNGWIPVSERLPENGVPVLFQIKKDNRMYVGYCNNAFKEFYIITARNSYTRGIKPIAWMPLPQAFSIDGE